MVIGGLDLGTSGCKFAIYKDTVRISEASASYPAIHDGQHHSIDSNIVWNSVCNVIKQAVFASPDQNEKVQAISVSSFGEAATPIDKDGNALSNALLFWDNSGEEQNASIIDKLGVKTIENITGVLPDKMFTINKIAWFRDNKPEIYEKAVKFLLFEDLIIYRMTGEYAISYSLANRTMGFDNNKLCWSKKIFDAAEVDMDKMSCLYPSGTVVGQVLPSIANYLGLSSKCVMVTGGHDQMCVALGGGAISPGLAVNGSGTVEALSTILNKNANYDKLYDNCYSCSVYADESKHFTYAWSSTGSILLEWYIKTFGFETMPGLSDGKDAYTLLEASAVKEPTKMLFLPYFEGTGTPYNDYNAKGVFMGMNLSTTKQDIYRALMEGLAYDLCININALESAGVYINEIRATGGGAKSPMWLQIKADVTGKPISLLSTTQSGTLGCMILASVAMGYYSSLEEAIHENVRISKVFEPNLAYRNIYNEKIRQFSLLYYATKNIL